MIDMTKAMQDVSKHFVRPGDIVAAEGISEADKVKLLRQWEYDLRSLMVAADENMADAQPEGSAPQLSEVHAALAKLGEDAGAEGSGNAPTMQGGR